MDDQHPFFVMEEYLLVPTIARRCQSRKRTRQRPRDVSIARHCQGCPRDECCRPAKPERRSISHDDLTPSQEDQFGVSVSHFGQILVQPAPRRALAFQVRIARVDHLRRLAKRSTPYVRITRRLQTAKPGCQAFLLCQRGSRLCRNLGRRQPRSASSAAAGHCA